jgi:hypothetical protein
VRNPGQRMYRIDAAGLRVNPVFRGPMRPGRTGRAPPDGTGWVAGIRLRPGSRAPCMICGIGSFVTVVVPFGSPPGAVIFAEMVSSPGAASPFPSSSSPPVRADLVSSPMSMGNFLAVRRTFFQKSRNFPAASWGARRRPFGFRAGDRAGRPLSRDGFVRRRFPGRPVMARAIAPAAPAAGALGSPAAGDPVASSTGSDHDRTGRPDRPRSGPRRSRLAGPTD